MKTKKYTDNFEPLQGATGMTFSSGYFRYTTYEGLRIGLLFCNGSMKLTGVNNDYFIFRCKTTMAYTEPGITNKISATIGSNTDLYLYCNSSGFGILNSNGYLRGNQIGTGAVNIFGSIVCPLTY